jgi:hypothetical protein
MKALGLAAVLAVLSSCAPVPQSELRLLMLCRPMMHEGSPVMVCNGQAAPSEVK